MTTHKSTRRDNHVIPIHGKKRTTYKVLIRRKVNGVSETFCETHKTLKEARAARNLILGDSSKLRRLAGAGARTLFKDIADEYAREYTGKDDRFPQRLDYWTDLQDRINNDFRNVLSACPNWYSEPAREAIDTMLATSSQTIADHKAAKQAQG